MRGAIIIDCPDAAEVEIENRGLAVDNKQTMRATDNLFNCFRRCLAFTLDGDINTAGTTALNVDVQIAR